VSLTVNDVEDEGGTTRFSVNIIPHTAENTTFGDLELGQQLNVEIDVLARYLERMIDAKAHSGS
jgi:riboflavin synthase